MTKPIVIRCELCRAELEVTGGDDQGLRVLPCVDCMSQAVEKAKEEVEQ